MNRRALGLDISDDFIAAVVVQQKGQERRVHSCAFHERDGEDLAALLPPLLAEVGWHGGIAVCGVPLAGVSVRNLSLPFSGRKRIDQVLPLELEDQLLTPVDEQVVEYLVTAEDEHSSAILVAGLEKEALRRQLDELARGGLGPDVLTLRSMVLAEQLVRTGRMPAAFLLLDAGVHGLNMVLVRAGIVVFVRHLPYPDRIYTAAPFSFRNGMASIGNTAEAVACITGICEDIRRGIGFFSLEFGVAVEPEQVVLTGSMLQVEELRTMLSAALGQEIVPCSLKREADVSLAAELREGWQPALFDHALALALNGLKQRQGVNFRKNEFAPQRLLLASQPRVIVAAALALVLLVGGGVLLGLDHRALKNKYDDLGGKMEALYRETFPGATRVVDPLTQMQANIKDIQAPSIATPVFSGDKRVLNILADISARIPKELTIHVIRLVVDQDSVQIKGDTDTFNNVNVIQGNLRQSPLFDDVAIVSAAADKEGGMIRFELRLRTGGAS